MKIFKPIIFFILSFSLCSCGGSRKTENLSPAFAHAVTQTNLLLEEIEEKDQTRVFPRSVTTTEELELVQPKDWTSGFFPGSLWYLFERTGNKKWLENAKKYTSRLESEKNNSSNHDTGFKIYCSYGNAYRLTKNEAYKNVIVKAAQTLSSRFNPEVGAIRSWDHNTDKWKFPVIIDNMMNLELLFAATRLSGDSTYYKIAVSHANTTLKNHFRADNSSFHVVGFDKETGRVVKKSTHQGYSDESAWARGQAWGLYGFTMAYRETSDKKYLMQAQKIAEYILNRLPEDFVPYWDYDAPNIKNQPRDVSAAAITASALYELSLYSEKYKEYRIAADKMLTNLFSKYRSTPGKNKGFILKNSTGNKPKNREVDVPLNYADYYYLEALIRQEGLSSN